MSNARCVVSLCIAVLFIWASAAVAQPPNCPTPPNRVQVTVNASVAFDGASGLYTYRYTVVSDRNSLQPVSDFAVDFASPISHVMNPQGWTNGTFADRATIGWSATVAAPLPPGVPDTGQLPHGLFEILPGRSIDGFSFQSPFPPGPVNFYVLGFIDIPVVHSEEEAETLAEICPQMSGGFFNMAVTGVTDGPVLAIPVQIDIKPGSAPNPVNPRADGVMPVAILGSSAFDVTSVDQTTVRFGPGSAAAQKDAGHTEDVNGDGFLDLIFHFPTAAAGIACGDTAAALTGATTSGVPIRGSDSVVTVGCKK
jgi:hypothetical protein